MKSIIQNKPLLLDEHLSVTQIARSSLPLFGTTTDLEAKRLDFQHYYEHRTHAGRQGYPPVTGVDADHSLANLSCYRWHKRCRGLYQTPMAT